MITKHRNAAKEEVLVRGKLGLCLVCAFPGGGGGPPGPPPRWAPLTCAQRLGREQQQERQQTEPPGLRPGDPHPERATRSPDPAPPSSDPGIQGPQLLRPRIQESRPSPSPSAPGALTPAPPPSDPGIPVQPRFLKPGSPGPPAPPPSNRGVGAPSSSAFRPRSPGPAPPPSAAGEPTPARPLSVWVPALLTAATSRSRLQPQLAPVTEDPSSSLTSCPEIAPRLQEYPTPPPSCRAHPRPWA